MSLDSRRPFSDAPTPALISRLAHDMKHLVRAEVDLARAELTKDWRRERRTVEGLGFAAVCVLCALNLLLVSVVLALGERAMPGWAAALAVAAGVLAVGTAFGAAAWALRVKQPLQKTRKTLKEDVQWAKQRMA